LDAWATDDLQEFCERSGRGMGAKWGERLTSHRTPQRLTEERPKEDPSNGVPLRARTSCRDDGSDCLGLVRPAERRRLLSKDWRFRNYWRRQRKPRSAK